MEQLNGAPNNEKEKWLRIMSKVGTMEPGSRSAMLNHLNASDDPQSVVLAIDSLAPMGASAEERNETVMQLNQYLHSENENVRASAIESLSYWNRKNDPSYVSNGLRDESAIVRGSAIEAAEQTAMASNEIKGGLFSILNNESLTLEERMMASGALQRQDLTDAEYDMLASFTRKYLN